mmetsp:Transcript_19966/g.60632  ORF Transcript_19966/g.60632 Transcript_19966/m.60632 type:complete len:209 (-) Transcript_19966:1230-1856(-)
MARARAATSPAASRRSGRAAAASRSASSAPSSSNPLWPPAHGRDSPTGSSQTGARPLPSSPSGAQQRQSAPTRCLVASIPFTLALGRTSATTASEPPAPGTTAIRTPRCAMVASRSAVCAGGSMGTPEEVKMARSCGGGEGGSALAGAGEGGPGRAAPQPTHLNRRGAQVVECGRELRAVESGFDGPLRLVHRTEPGELVLPALLGGR